MIKKPKISIIIPVYNRSFLIRETLKSIQTQTYQNWECIIVDDNSTDDTWEVISVFSTDDTRIRAFQKPIELLKGPSTSRNFGLLKSKGEIIHFFDSDDVLGSNLYEEIIDSYNVSQFDCLLTRIAFFVDSKENIRSESQLFLMTDFIINGLIGNNAFYTQNVFWRKCFLDRTKVRFNENISMCEDLDFDIRNIIMAEKFIVRNDLFVYIRNHNDSLSRNLDQKNVVKRNLSWLSVIQDLSIYLSDKGLNNLLMSRYITKLFKHLIIDLIRNNCIISSFRGYWIYMSKVMMNNFQPLNFLIYNLKIAIEIILAFFKNNSSVKI